MDIDNYDFISLPRSQRYKRKSGDIGIYVRSYLSKYVKLEQNSTEYILWVSVDKSVTNLPENLLLGSVYVPPENSKFFTQDEFELFEASVANTCCNYKYVVVAGDTNSRTAQLSNFVRSDTFLLDLFGVDFSDRAELEKYIELQNLGLSLDRKSQDKKN